MESNNKVNISNGSSDKIPESIWDIIAQNRKLQNELFSWETNTAMKLEQSQKIAEITTQSTEQIGELIDTMTFDTIKSGLIIQNFNSLVKQVNTYMNSDTEQIAA